MDDVKNCNKSVLSFDNIPWSGEIDKRLKVGSDEYRVYISPKGKEARTYYHCLAQYRRKKWGWKTVDENSFWNDKKLELYWVSDVYVNYLKQNFRNDEMSIVDNYWAMLEWNQCRNDTSSEYDYYSLVLLKPVTGRTHQLRVHLKSIGHPIVCDAKYGSKTRVKRQVEWCDRLFLHCYSLQFKQKSGEDVVIKSDPFENKDSDFFKCTFSHYEKFSHLRDILPEFNFI